MTTEEIDFIVHEETDRMPISLLWVMEAFQNPSVPLRPLQDGDIINIDVTVYLNGYHGDTSETSLVGNVDEGGRNLVEIARRCRNEAITASSLGSYQSHSAIEWFSLLFPEKKRLEACILRLFDDVGQGQTSERKGQIVTVGPGPT
ncbi:UNVERIFIED_CONTAM: hypothetical protein FKN15_004213 [Acipenser sinensis]